MKYIFPIVMLFFLAAPAMADVASGTKGDRTWNVGMVAEPAKGSVSIDGDLAEWDLSGQILTGTIGHEDRMSVRTAAMWDEKALYLSFAWRDPTPLHSRIDPANNTEKGWVDDAVQLRMEVAGVGSWITMWCFEKSVQAFRIDYFRMQKDAKGRSLTWASEPSCVDVGPEGVKMATREAEDGGGWTLECRIPWCVLTNGSRERLAAGERFRMGLEFMWGNNAGNWPAYRTTDCFSGMDVQTGFFWTTEKSWGEVELSAVSVPNTRTYRAEPAAAYGCVPVRAKIPAGKEKFTLVLEDPTTGERVRTVTGGHPVAEAKVGEENGLDVIEVLWDGLDDLGRPVAPGSYRVRGIAMDRIRLRYESTFYNPGTPPWDTADGTGGWGADHSRPQFLAAAGSNVVFGARFPEGGYGLWAVGPDGRKCWSEKRGVRALAANAAHVYVLGGYYNEEGQRLFRVDSSTGKYAAFQDAKGNVLPSPFPLSSLDFRRRQSTPVQVKNIAADPNDKTLALALDDGSTALVDANSMRVLRILPTAVRSFAPYGEGRREKAFGISVPVEATPLAFDGCMLYYFQRHGARLVAFDVDTSAVRAIDVSESVGIPVALAVSSDGRALYVADAGPDMQVKKFDIASGSLLAAFGRRGGRPRQGKFAADGVLDPWAVAEDAHGDVWIAENTDFPRRTGVWSGKNGSLLRDYIGNAFYCGSGTLLHDNDHARAYAGGVEFAFDPETGASRPLRTLWNPDPRDGRRTFVIGAGSHGLGPAFRSSASGREREFFFQSGGDGWKLFMSDGNGGCRPVAAVSTVGRLLSDDDSDAGAVQAPYGEWAGLDPRDSFIWNDADGDGFVSRSECEVLPASEGTLPCFLGWGARPDAETLDIYAAACGKSATWWKYRPVRFAADGAPVYAREGLERMGEGVPWEMPDIAPVSGEDTVLRFATESGCGMIVATDKRGRFKWRYRDWWHGVHGSHRSPDGNPNGRIFGAIMITGFADAGGDCGRVAMIRGNSTHDYWMTTDGLYLDKVFRRPLDGRTLPPTVEEARKMPFEELIGHGEPFMGWFGKQDDGRIRSIHGSFALACHVCEVTGFETARRFDSGSFVFSAEDAAKADAFRRGLAATKSGKPAPYVFGSRTMVSGDGVTAEVCLSDVGDALRVEVAARGDRSPWKNGGNDFTRLFKTGDCFDVQIGETGMPATAQRVVFANLGGKTVAVQMRPADPLAPKDEAAVYESPVASLSFDRVRILPVEVNADVSEDKWKLCADVPWILLGIDAAKPLRGDFGLILSDPDGRRNVARHYLFNKDTGLVSDLPNEARIRSSAWGAFERAQTFSTKPERKDKK